MSEQAKDTAVAVRGSVSPLQVMGEKYNVEPAKLMDVLRGTVIKSQNGKPATNEEIAAFCIVANEYGLSPFLREIHAFSSKGAIVPIVGIDGWTHLVNNHPGFDGCEFSETASTDGKPESITCAMYVKGRSHPVTATERFSECVRPTEPWKQMPWRMLRHKAYMQAARYAFGLSGIYDEDEGRDIIQNTVPEREPIKVPRALPTVTTTASAQPDIVAKAAMPEVVEGEVVAPVQPVTPETTEPPPPAAVDGNTVRGVIEDVIVKSGKGKKGDWTRYGIKVGGEIYGTFDAKLGELAQSLDGTAVVLTFKEDGKFKNTVDIVADAAEPAPAPERQPGDTDDLPFGDDEPKKDDKGPF